MTSHSDPRSPSGSPGAPETGATKCANCDQPYERHGRIDGEGATCPDRSGQGFEPVGSPGAETPPPAKGAETWSTPCTLCGMPRLAHSVVMEACPRGGGRYTLRATQSDISRNICVGCGVSCAFCICAPPPSVSQGAPADEIKIDGRRFVRNTMFSKYPNRNWLRVGDDGNYHFAVAEAWLNRIAELQQQLADAIRTARYQSDVARQADDAREKAEHERDAVIATAADTIFTTTQTWVEKLAFLQAENAGLRAKLEHFTARKFPIMGGPTIPWASIAPYDGQAQRNHSQTLERLAERGGLDVHEALHVMRCVDRHLRSPESIAITAMPKADAIRALIALATPTPPQERP
jgi:hypothetical protein